MQNAAIEMHWLMVNHVSRLKKAEKPKMLVWRTEFGRGVFFGGKLNKPCGYWFCQKWLLIISKRPKKSSEWCYFNLTPPTDHGAILRRSPLKRDSTATPFKLCPPSTKQTTAAAFHSPTQTWGRVRERVFRQRVLGQWLLLLRLWGLLGRLRERSGSWGDGVLAEREGGFSFYPFAINSSFSS